MFVSKWIQYTLNLSVLGNSCNKEEDVFCKRIEGASCKGKVCTCDAGFRPLADIECEAGKVLFSVIWNSRKPRVVVYTK